MVFSYIEIGDCQRFSRHKRNATTGLNLWFISTTTNQINSHLSFFCSLLVHCVCFDSLFFGQSLCAFAVIYARQVGEQRLALVYVAWANWIGKLFWWKTTNDRIKASKLNSITKTKNTTTTTVLSSHVGSLIPMPADLRVGFYYLLAYVFVLHGFTHRKNNHASEQIPLYFGRENVVKKCLECRIFNFITMI